MSKHVKNQSHTDNYGGYPVFDAYISSGGRYSAEESQDLQNNASRPQC